MPRKPKKSPDEIFVALEGMNFVSEGDYLPFNNPVWQFAADRLNNALSKDYVYLYITQNRNKIAQRLCGENMPANEKQETKEKCIEGTDPNWSMHDDNNPLPALREKIHLSQEQWSRISPVEVSYQSRTYETLKPGWTSLIYECLWDKLKLPCAFQFKNSKINNLPGDVYLKISGKCSECQTKVNLYSAGYPSNDGIDLNVSTNDTRNIAHVKKRRLRAPLRRKIAEQLQGKSTFMWHRDEANRLMEFGDVEPANLFSEDVLRKSKQQHRDAELGLSNITNPIESLQQLKYSAEFAGSLHEIAIDKFYIMYWSPEQIFLYKHLLKDGSIDSISIDATGSLIKPIPKPDASKRVIFLYQIVAPVSGRILPICQFISEKHDANTLSYWLREWLRCCCKIPKVVVSDYSLALLNAFALAFNKTDLLSYVNDCINVLLGDALPKSDLCVIRIDIAHLIKSVCRWACFQKRFPAVKDFYVRCVALLSMTTTITEFRRLCTDVLLVSFSSTEDVDDGTNSCFAAQKRLVGLIKGSTETDLYIPAEGSNTMCATFEDSNDVQTSNFTTESSAIDHFLTRLKSDSKPDENGNRPNPYFCPDFGNRLLKLSKHFVLWTAVMTSVFKRDGKTPYTSSLVASSARSEEYFRELKSLIMNRAPTFGR